MYTPNRILGFIKESFTKQKISTTPTPEWSDNQETVSIKKTEYEALQTEIFDKTEIIKRLKSKEEETKSVISEYERAFETFTKEKGQCPSVHNLLDEIEALRSNESRLKAHIQALKRDLVLCEEKAENESLYKEQTIQNLKDEQEELKNTVKKQNLRIQELSFSNSEMKHSLVKKAEKLIEMSAICKEFLKEN